MTPHQRWTQTDLDDLRARLAGGEQVDQVAEATGRTAVGVQAMVTRLRLRVRLT